MTFFLRSQSHPSLLRNSQESRGAWHSFGAEAFRQTEIPCATLVVIYPADKQRRCLPSPIPRYSRDRLPWKFFYCSTASTSRRPGGPLSQQSAPRRSVTTRPTRYCRGATTPGARRLGFFIALTAKARGETLGLDQRLHIYTAYLTLGQGTEEGPLGNRPSITDGEALNTSQTSTGRPDAGTKSAARKEAARLSSQSLG